MESRDKPSGAIFDFFDHDESDDYHRFENSENPKLEGGDQITACHSDYEREWKTIRPFKFKFKKLLAFAGPGFLMSIAYLDPGNIAGDLTAGLKGGYRLIWTLMYATALGLYYQSFAVRIGVVTERNLAKLCAQQFSPFTRYLLWIMTELAIIACDIQEVLGSATALYLLFGIKIWVGVLITILDSFIFLFIHYFGVRKLEFFFAFLIFVMASTFMINMVEAKPDYSQVAFGMFVPTVPEGASGAALGLIGAVIMPHNFYLHSQLVLSRRVDNRNRSAQYESIVYNCIESGISLFVSFAVSTAVITTFAVYTLKNPDKDENLDLLSASFALRDTFGESSKYIWAIGLLAAGQSSTMTGTYAGQFVMEGFLDIKLPVYKRVLLTRAIAVVPAIIITFFEREQLTNLDSGLNILQSIQLPFALIPLIKFVTSPKIMGAFTISKPNAAFAILFGMCLFAFNIREVFTEFLDEISWVHILIFVVYTSLLLKVMLEPV